MKSVKLHAEVIEAAQAWERRSIVAFTVAPRRSTCSIRPLPQYVAGRIVVADPDLAPVLLSHSAADAPGIVPDDLCVVTASSGATVSMVIVARLFRCPGIHHLSLVRGRPHNFEKILSVLAVSPMFVSASPDEVICPVLRERS